jgi:hypothetical protein
VQVVALPNAEARLRACWQLVLVQDQDPIEVLGHGGRSGKLAHASPQDDGGASELRHAFNL